MKGSNHRITHRVERREFNFAVNVQVDQDNMNTDELTVSIEIPAHSQVLPAQVPIFVEMLHEAEKIAERYEDQYDGD